jgi:methylthioribose-1-phosphate isomerase
MLALAAHDNEVPAYAAVPTSTIDLKLASGLDIPIEERSSDEVLNLEIDGNPVVPNGAAARNPAFDITPHRLVSAIITEHEIVKPPYIRNLERVVRSGSPG